MGKMVKITEEKMAWFQEKILERQEYKRDAEVAKWNMDIAMRGLRMTPKDWQMYYDFIKHNWFSVSEKTKEQELAFAAKMIETPRNEEGYMAFAQFVKRLHDLEFYDREKQ